MATATINAGLPGTANPWFKCQGERCRALLKEAQLTAEHTCPKCHSECLPEKRL
ncbi:MAG: hypothetical protein JWO13_2243 [Acidobacteriales bacterium]|nr:hypothetical protein [Terriglobales bacterium]